MKKKELIDLCLISNRRLNQMIADGTVPDSSDPFKVVPAYIKFIRKSPQMADAQLRRVLAKAKIDELRALRDEGNLISKDEPLKWLEGHVAEAKNAFLGLPRRMSETLAAESDSKSVEFILQKEIRKILEDLANGK